MRVREREVYGREKGRERERLEKRESLFAVEMMVALGSTFRRGNQSFVFIFSLHTHSKQTTVSKLNL